MADVTNELMFETLSQIQARLTNIEGTVTEVKVEIAGVRGHLHAIELDVANLCSAHVRHDQRLACIERRLDLADAPAH